MYIRKSVIGSNIHIEVNDFLLTLDRVFNDSRRFGFSTRRLGHVMFSFVGTAQKAGAGGSSRGGAGIPVRCSLMDSSREGKHHVTKTSS